MKKTAVVLSAIMATSCLGMSSQAENLVQIEKISGADRFFTAISIAQNGWPSGSETAILVNAQAVADSLSVAPLASQIKAPVLLTENKFLNKDTKKEIERLGAKNIVIIGGDNSVSKDIEARLQEEGYNTQRISGSTRIETSVNIAKSLKELGADSKEAFVVNGMKGLADAAGVGAIAAKNEAPIIFTTSTGNQEVQELLGEELQIPTAYLIGGGASLPNSFNNITPNTDRIAGENRQETNLNIIKKFYPEVETVYIADDGSEKSSKLIDSVLINAGIIASNSEAPSYIKTDDSVQEEEVQEEEVKEESKLPEGPVMLVSGKNGFSYNQMENLYNQSPSRFVQVSGGETFEKGIENLAYFIENKDNEAVVKTFEKLLRFRNMQVEYNVNGIKTVLTANAIKPMLYLEGNEIKVKEESLRVFAEKINISGMKSNKSQKYAYWKNRDVKISTVRDGVEVDVDNEVKTLIKIVENGYPVYNRIPNTINIKPAIKGTALGSTYVQIDIASQHMWVYKNNKVVVSTPIVSGNPNRGAATPPGIFKIRSKMRNVVLRGPGYASPVKYWIPFNGSIGIHDASWQPVYGGSRYLYAGSHGCINTPLGNVGKLYNYVSVGTPVIVQRHK